MPRIAEFKHAAAKMPHLYGQCRIQRRSRAADLDGARGKRRVRNADLGGDKRRARLHAHRAPSARAGRSELIAADQQGAGLQQGACVGHQDVTPRIPAAAGGQQSRLHHAPIVDRQRGRPEFAHI
ncbi:hypothetical protein D3C73_1397990 [compost metagenome]